MFGQFSNITIQFLPKNTTSKLQPLDSGIIANWKVLYRKRMLRYVCSQVNGEKNMSEIIKSINVFMAIEWRREAWNDFTKALSRSALRRLVCIPVVNQSRTTPLKERNDDDYPTVCPSLPIDPSNPNWREVVRSELLDDDLEVQFASEGTSIDSNYDTEFKEPSIKKPCA